MSFCPVRADIEKFFGPKASTKWVDALCRVSPSMCDYYGFTRLRWVHFIGQVSAETDRLTISDMVENMNYTSADRIMEIYAYRLGVCIERRQPVLGRIYASRSALARALVRQPETLADIVYGGREGTPWMQGSKYLGRGPLQTTHLNNYRTCGEEVARQPGGGVYNLVDRPEMVARDADLGWRATFAEWKIKGLNKWADANDVDKVSDALNTGSVYDNVKPHGLDMRRRETARALAIWPEPIAGATEEAASGVSGLRQGDKGGEVKRLQERLAELGFATGPADGVFGVLTARALTAFQAEHGLKVDGIAGPRTLEVMAASAKAPGPHNDIGPKDLPKSTTLHALKWGRRTVNAGLTFLGLNEVDNQAGLGLVDAAVSKVEQTKGLAERISALGIGLPSAHAVSLLAALGAGAALLYFINRAEFGRVLAARKGG